jgi:NUDIX domain
MKFQDFFQRATSSIKIIGTNALIPYLEQNAKFLADHLTVNKDLHILILCESDNENFNQSLCTDTKSSRRRLSFANLGVHRDRIMGTGKKDGLMEEIRGLVKDIPQAGDILKRINIKQVNLRLPVNIIEADGEIWCCFITNSAGNLDSYFNVDGIPNLKTALLEFIEFYIDPQKGGIYLSKPREELIQLYDKNGIPRGIFPRACFYTTEFSRYSVWGFIFNRKGELLLHQRSMQTKDGRGLWDKSIGGHVDLGDSSTSITAERELVEEMFLPQAEFTKYLRADLGDIIHFGEWNPKKRPERAFKGALDGLTEPDWVMFSAIDANGEPLTVTRVSDRRIHGDDGNVTTKRTIFRSDVYLFIAPKGYLDTEEQMKKLLGKAEEEGAAQDHKLISIEGLREWIAEAEAQGLDRETFTDDILFINLQYRELLEGFSEFVKFVAGD